MSSFLRRVAVYAAVLVGLVAFGAVPASAGTAQVEYLCRSRGPATPATIQITVEAPTSGPVGDAVAITIIVVHGTTPVPLPTGSRIAFINLLVQGSSPEVRRYTLANPSIPAGPITYMTSVLFGSSTPGVVTIRPGDISFYHYSQECVPRYPDSVPVLATIQFS
jgi:hypothetical protein